jgi:hypothetical protein
MAGRRNREWVIAVILRAIVVANAGFLQAHFATAEDIATGGGITRLIDAQLKEWKSSGTVAGCEVLYTVGYEDHISRDGAMVLMRGSLSVNRAAPAGDISADVVLKAAALDFDGDTFTAAPMHSAFLVAGGRSYADKAASAFPCEDEGLCSVYHAEAVLGQAIGEGFAVSYRRSRRGGDVTVPVNLARTRPQLSADFASCVQAVMSR